MKKKIVAEEKLSRSVPLMSWERTELWKQLLRRRTPESQSIRLLLEKWLPRIEKILLYGGTGPLDFTLHDAGHAERVADRMAQLIPPDVMGGLSTYELALLLLAAYLHDIGMTPEQRKVSTHFQYLVTGNQEVLTPLEVQQFQNFLDDHAEGISVPLTHGTPTSFDLKRASRLITYYSRDRHNDWSEEWIQKHLADEKLGTYAGWLEDLIALCRSHHEGYSALSSDRFKPRIVGNPTAVVHLRYLAVVLRVADVLEFDPERTPEIILRHRDISPSSLLYWYKDHEISIMFEDSRVVLAARPSNARIHRAIEIMADDIDKELSIARALADETHFDKCPGLNKTLKHRWDLTPSLHRQIGARESRYEYIDGAFRPDTNKLLELLSGVELYGSHLDAIRELVQNALDAVRIQIAHERLARPEEKEKDLALLLGRLHIIDLNLEATSDGPCLTCRDTGVGMTKAIIRDRLLVAGTGQPREVRALERKCKDAGFNLAVTGQFGIGVLSYFMISDHLLLRTRRALQAGDSDNSGWMFETEGVGSFGELRQDLSMNQGTSVQLYLRPELFGKSLQEFYANVRNYLIRSLHWLPCKLVLRSSVPGCPELSMSPGWTRSEEKIKSTILGQMEKQGNSRKSGDLIPLTQQRQVEKEREHWEIVKDEASKCLQLLVEEGDLPKGLGKYRVAMPYFELLNDKVLAFLRVDASGGDISLQKIGNGFIQVNEGRLNVSWKGILPTVPLHLQVDRFYGENRAYGIKLGTMLCDVSWESAEAGGITVNRHALRTSETASEALRWLSEKMKLIRTNFISAQKSHHFTTLNYRIAEDEPYPENLEIQWLAHARSEIEKDVVPAAKWIKYDFPVTTAVLFNKPLAFKLEWQANPVAMVDGINKPGSKELNDGITWNTKTIAPDRVAVCPKLCWEYPQAFAEHRNRAKTYAELAEAIPGVQDDAHFNGRFMSVQFGIVPLWTKAPNQSSRILCGLACHFPPNWPQVCSVKFESYTESEGVEVWNPSHPIIRHLDKDAWQWAQKVFKENRNPLPYRDELMVSAARASSWIVRCLQESSYEMWDALAENNPEFLPSLWKVIFGGATDPLAPICQWVEGRYGFKLRTLSSAGWVAYRDWHKFSAIFKKYLPDPGLDWRLLPERDELSES